METKKEYTAPQLTVVSFKPERGYASSFFFLHIFQNEEEDGFDNNNQEYWLWNDNDNSFGGNDWGWGD